jgi:hypothetical protein
MIALVEQPFVCVHCSKTFMKEKTLVAHMCERKRRALQKDEKRVQAGFLAFNRFWQLTQNNKKSKTYDDFADSSYYNAFVKFGSFINNISPLYPDRFIDFVIKSGVKLDHWCRDELYEKYLQEILKVEPVESAVQRSIQTMMDWADETGACYEHYFEYASLNRAVHDIVNGKISCWVILNSNQAKTMIDKMSDEQLIMISPVFDVKYWTKRFKERPADTALVLEILKECTIS